MKNNISQYESEVDFFNQMMGDTLDLKRAVFEDEDFKDYLLHVGLEETLYEVTSFARSIEENLRTNGFLYEESREADPKWVRSARSLHSTFKSRRQQLRKAVAGMYGEDTVAEIQERVDKEVED